MSFTTDLNKKCDVKFPETVIEALTAEGYTAVAHLEEEPITQDEFRAMQIPMRFAKKLAATFGPEEAPTAPPTKPAPEKTDGDDLDNLFDGEVTEITWAKIKLQSPLAIEKLVKDFFADPTDKRRIGYRFMVAVRQGTGRGPVAKLKGKPSEVGTAKLINALAIDRAKFDGEIFVAGPNEMYLTCMIEDMDRNIAKRDVLMPYDGFLQEGTGLSWMGARLYTDDWTELVLPEEVQLVLAYAQKTKELTQEIAIRISDSIRGREQEVTIEDVRWHLQRTYRAIYVVGVSDEEMPKLEGENRPFFAVAETTEPDNNETSMMADPTAKLSTTAKRTSLRNEISTTYNLGELRTLCFDASIPYEDIAGETKNDKIRELIAYAERKNKMSLLLTVLREGRPSATFTDPRI